MNHLPLHPSDVEAWVASAVPRPGVTKLRYLASARQSDLRTGLRFMIEGLQTASAMQTVVALGREVRMLIGINPSGRVSIGLRPAEVLTAITIVSSIMSACVATPSPVIAPDAPRVATVEAPPAGSMTIAVAPESPGPAEAPPVVSSEFDIDGLAVPRSRMTTPPVHQVSMPLRLTKKWNTTVGRTTFRTTMAMVGDAIILGTHGLTLNGKNEKSDGVYVLEARTGKVRSTIRAPGTGDLDVGGVAIDGSTVYFSTDNSQVVAAALDGRILWTAKGKGKVRPAPALADLNGDGKVDVIVGDENGELYALDGNSGQRLWTAQTGVNRYTAQGFIGAAAIADLDGDGKDDVVAGARDGIMVGYRGRDGSPLWQVGGDSGIHASPVIADFDQDGIPEVVAAWSYGDVAILDGRTGRKRWTQVVSQDSGGIEGIFGSPIPLSGSPGLLVVPTAWWGKEDGIVGLGMMSRVFKSFEGRMSSSAVVTDIDNDGQLEAILGTERGVLVALRADGSHAKLATLGGPIEATALLADTDGNGTQELLVASNDGQLTCFETGSRSKPGVSRFRGESPHNRGNVGPTKLGWRRSEPRGPVAAARANPGPQVRIEYLTCCQALQEEATRAPSPANRELVQAAIECLKAASGGANRAVALQKINSVLGNQTPLPKACH